MMMDLECNQFLIEGAFGNKNISATRHKGRLVWQVDSTAHIDHQEVPSAITAITALHFNLTQFKTSST